MKVFQAAAFVIVVVVGGYNFHFPLRHGFEEQFAVIDIVIVYIRENLEELKKAIFVVTKFNIPWQRFC